jgi:hypothetical protein
MNLKDYIGKRGEKIFSVLITKWCDGRPWFDELFLGEKAEAKDFLVNLIEPSSGDASCYIQVKATNEGYTGQGRKRKLKVGLSKEDVEKLKAVHARTYVVGIDIQKERGYILAITSATKRGFSRLPTKHPLNCKTIKALWNEVDDYWKSMKAMLPSSSALS